MLREAIKWLVQVVLTNERALLLACIADGANDSQKIDTNLWLLVLQLGDRVREELWMCELRSDWRTEPK